MKGVRAKSWAAGRALVAVTAALLVATVGARINPPAANATAGPDVEPILRRPIKDATVNVRSLGDAVRTLADAAGVRIVLDDRTDPHRGLANDADGRARP